MICSGQGTSIAWGCLGSRDKRYYDIHAQTRKVIRLLDTELRPDCDQCSDLSVQCKDFALPVPHQ